MTSNTFDRIAFISLLVVVGLLPLFFVPFSKIPVETSKGLLVVFGLIVTAVSWSVARFFDGKISLSRSLVLFSTLGIVIIALLSSLFAPVAKWSLFGTIFDIGSFFFLLACFFLLFFTAIFLKKENNSKTILLTVILSFLVFFLFQMVRLFFPAVLAFGVLEGKIGNVLGSWNTVGLLAGLACVISLLSIEVFSVDKKSKWLPHVLLVLSLFFMVVVNFSLAWGLLAVFSLIVFVLKVLYYTRDKQSPDNSARFPTSPLFVLIFSIIFLMSGATVQSYVPTKLGVLNREIRPNFGATMWVAKETLKTSPIFGAGPGRFSEMWALHKPEEVNESQFWNTNFDFGAGIIPTLIVTLGGLGILGFLFFIIFLLKDGIGSLLESIKRNIGHNTTVFFLSSMYLVVAASFYTVGSATLFLMFIFVGAFIGSRSKDQLGKEISFSFLEDPRKSFFAIIFLVLFIIFATILGFKFTGRFIGTHYYTRAINSTDIIEAEKLIGKAISLNTNDLFLRAQSQILLGKLGYEVETNTELSEDKKEELRGVFNNAENSAVLAAEFNPKNHLNFQALGALYEVAGSLGVPDSYSKALVAYQSASNLSPTNPGLKLSMARAYWFLKQPNDAKELARQALALKPDYVEAIVFLSQVAKNEGDLKTALTYAKQALTHDPNNEELIRYMESLNAK